MSFTKSLKKLILPAGLPLLLLAELTSLNLYLNHNVSYETRTERVYKKADGVLSHTEVKMKNDCSIEVRRDLFGRCLFYVDKEGDGLVDTVYRSENFLKRGDHLDSFQRSTDLNLFPEVFESADEDFQNQMRRFKPIISNSN